jgi:hypothetical protein
MKQSSSYKDERFPRTSDTMKSLYKGDSCKPPNCREVGRVVLQSGLLVIEAILRPLKRSYLVCNKANNAPRMRSRELDKQG